MKITNYWCSAKEHLYSERLGGKLKFETISCQEAWKKKVWVVPPNFLFKWKEKASRSLLDIVDVRGML